MKYNLKKKYQIAMRRLYIDKAPSKEIVNLIGLDKNNFQEYVNKFVLAEMNVEDFGKTWGLDHIVPVELFDLENDEELKCCYSFLNIMPMFNSDNRFKGASIHFSRIKLVSLFDKEINEENKVILQKLINKCDEEILNRYNKYLI